MYQMYTQAAIWSLFLLLFTMESMFRSDIGKLLNTTVHFSCVIKRTKKVYNVFLTLNTGKMAGHAMLGNPSNWKTVPFFWSMLFGKGVRFAGITMLPID